MVMECMEGGELFDRISIKVSQLFFVKASHIEVKPRFSTRSFLLV